MENLKSSLFMLLSVLTLTGALRPGSVQPGSISTDRDGIVKTIESGVNGVLIDCIDIHKQPALGHPLLLNHTVQMTPRSLYPIGEEEENPKGEPNFNQSWSKNGECPQGTIPILRRTRPRHHQPRLRFPQIIKDRNNASESPDEVIFVSPRGHEYAQFAALNGRYMGAAACVNVWEPIVFGKETSIAYIWLATGSESKNNVVMAGWMVNPFSEYANNATFFIYWKADGGQGCYNHDCPGFIQVGPEHVLGYPLQPVSTYSRQQFELDIKIVKDSKTSDWWLIINKLALGYWPASLFSGLGKGATIATWGGHVDFSTSPSVSRHTTTEMGSGHFPSEGFTKAAYFRKVAYTTGDNQNFVEQVGDFYKLITRPECYDVLAGHSKDPNWGTGFFYGGPGYSANCQYKS